MRKRGFLLVFIGVNPIFDPCFYGNFGLDELATDLGVRLIDEAHLI
jgi:hypothetical protein